MKVIGIEKIAGSLYGNIAVSNPKLFTQIPGPKIVKVTTTISPIMPPQNAPFVVRPPHYIE